MTVISHLIPDSVDPALSRNTFYSELAFAKQEILRFAENDSASCAGGVTDGGEAAISDTQIICNAVILNAAQRSEESLRVEELLTSFTVKNLYVSKSYLCDSKANHPLV